MSNSWLVFLECAFVQGIVWNHLRSFDVPSMLPLEDEVDLFPLREEVVHLLRLLADEGDWPEIDGLPCSSYRIYWAVDRGFCCCTLSSNSPSFRLVLLVEYVEAELFLVFLCGLTDSSFSTQGQHSHSQLSANISSPLSASIRSSYSRSSLMSTIVELLVLPTWLPKENSDIHELRFVSIGVLHLF